MTGNGLINSQIQTVKLLDFEPDVLLSLYSGTLLCKNFSDVHEAAEKLLDRPVLTHEFADPIIWRQIRKTIIAKCLIKNTDLDPVSQEFYQKVESVLAKHRL